MYRVNAKDAFWEKVAIKSDSECWEWKAAKHRKGYGVFCNIDRPNMTQAHRWSALFAGMEVDGNYVRHKCDNVGCVNPNHLETGTHIDNMRDMRERGRSSRGSSQHLAKLSESDIPEIRRRILSGETYARIAKDYGVSYQSISSIDKGRTWGHV